MLSPMRRTLNWLSTIMAIIPLVFICLLAYDFYHIHNTPLYSSFPTIRRQKGITKSLIMSFKKSFQRGKSWRCIKHSNLLYFRVVGGNATTAVYFYASKSLLSATLTHIFFLCITLSYMK